MGELIVPTVGCARVKSMGGSLNNNPEFPLEDKVVCNALHLDADCVVISVGVGWDQSFEIDIVRAQPHCKIHVFDPSVSRARYREIVEGQRGDVPRSLVDSQITFHQIGLGNVNESFLWTSVSKPKMLSLKGMFETAGVRHASILKIDAEG